jgi:hypothetical protein
MENQVVPFLRERMKKLPQAVGAVLVEKRRGADSAPFFSVDIMLIVFLDGEQTAEASSFYLVDTLRVEECRLHMHEPPAWVYSNKRNHLISWLLEGEILYDPYGRIRDLFQLLHRLPSAMRDKMICSEFSSLLRFVAEGRAELQREQLLDAYVALQQGLQHWARLAALEGGLFPRPKIWHQIQAVAPEVVKLYKELVEGRDSLKQRLQLVLLAAEYSTLTNLDRYCAYLLKLIGDGHGKCSLQQLASRLQTEQLELDVPLLIQELVKRSLVEEVVCYTGEVQECQYRLVAKK